MADRGYRIALATHGFSWENAGGGEVMIRLLAERLADRGHDVHVLTPDPRATMRSGKFTLHPLRSASTLALRAAFRAVKPDVVDAHNMECSIQSVLAARSLRIPVVVTVNSAWPACLFADMIVPGEGVCATCTVRGVRLDFERRPPEVIGRRVPAVVGYAETRRRLAMLRLADLLIAHSGASRDLLVRNGIPAERVRVVPNVTDEEFHAEPAPEGEHVICAGGLTYPKGTDVLVEAFALLAHERPHARLQLAGGGYLRPKLEEAASRLGLRDRVDFLGYVPRDELRERYRRARVVAFPPRTEEAFGRAVIEAWGVGVPIVTTDLSAQGELVRDGVNGLKVPPDDPKALAAALLRVLRDPALARRLADGGRAELPQYAADAVIPRFEAVYREAMGA